MHQPATGFPEWGGNTSWADNPKAWVLLEALQLYEGSLCSGCSQSALHTFDPMNTNQFELADDLVCLGCEAIESEKAPDGMPAGTKRYVVNHMSE